MKACGAPGGTTTTWPDSNSQRILVEHRRQIAAPNRALTPAPPRSSATVAASASGAVTCRFNRNFHAVCHILLVTIVMSPKALKGDDDDTKTDPFDHAQEDPGHRWRLCRFLGGARGPAS